MRLPSLAALVLLAAGCGPGAIDQLPVPAGERVLCGRSGDIRDALVVPNPDYGSFVEDGFYDDVKPTDPRIDAIRGSFTAAGDAETGMLSMSLDLPRRASAIAIPFATGPDPSLVSLRVTSVDGRVLAEFSDFDGLAEWRWWRVSLKDCPDDCRTVQLVAEDGGTAWGQWIAIGRPHLSR